MRLFKNRIEAANELAQHLTFLKEDCPIVLGLANGGVPLAEVIAVLLNAPLDVLLIEKLQAPQSPDQIVGAVDEHGRISMIQATARWHHLTSQQMVEPAREAFRLMQVRQARVRAVLPEVEVRGRTVIIVDEGVGTGAKMLGAIASLKDRGASKVVVAAPAGTSHATWQLHETADVVVIPHRPAKFKGIESFYENFTEFTDDMLVHLLERWIANRPQQQQGVKTIVVKLTGTRGQTIMCELDLPPTLTRGSGPYPAVIFSHGFESNARSSRSLTISRRLAKRDIIGVRMDFTGHGRSGGKIEDATDAQMLADLHVAYHSVMGLSEADPQRIGIVGSGTGGMIALYYAAQVPSVKALVIRGPVCGRETVAARQVKAPTLLIHAESDTALFDSVQTLDREIAAQHQLLRIPNSNRLFSDPISMDLMVSATVDWMVDHLVVSSGNTSEASAQRISTVAPQTATETVS